MIMTDEPGRYCGCHPATKRGLTADGNIGITISGIACEHRRLIKGMGWQSYCSKLDRISKGCE